MIKEEWRTIDGYPKYKVSNHGRVMSTAFRTVARELILKQSVRDKNKPYKNVTLSEGGKQKTCKVHTLVLNAFTGPKPTKLHECAHNDGNPSNNHVDNLRWATSKENKHDQRIHGTISCGNKHGQSKLKEEDVRYIRDNYVMDSRFKTNCKQLAKKFNVCEDTIVRIVRREFWKHI